MKKQGWFLSAVFVLAAILWIWGYSSINVYYNSLADSVDTVVYDVGEIVPFEQDWIESMTNAPGYSMRVDAFEIVDSQSYIDSIGFEPEQYYYPSEKTALVRITLFNEDNTEQGIMLTDLSLQGLDNILSMDWDLLAAANPVLEGNLGISLLPGTQYQLVLPYAMQEEYFSSYTWRNIENYELYLRLTLFPTKKTIRVQ